MIAERDGDQDEKDMQEIKEVFIQDIINKYSKKKEASE